VAVGGGVQGAAPASGAGRKGGVWRCGIYGGSGGTAEGAGDGRAAAGLGVRRRQGWACSGGRGLVASGHAGGGGGSFLLRFFGPNGPFILVGILEVV
jgi:hypothetical protein